MTTATSEHARLSLNQITTNSWRLPEAVDGCVAAGIESIGVWRGPLADYGVGAAAALIREAGLRVSSLCRGGFMTGEGAESRRRAVHDNTEAIREAAALDAACLVLVVGGLPEGSRDLPGARARVAEMLEEFVPIAELYDVRLALEPMHPIFTADRGVLATLAEALDLAERFPPERVGVVVDTFHVWWDPELESQLARAAGRIACFQICDWITPLPADTLLSRGMMGDGHIDFRRIHNLVSAAGYGGDIEVEIFNADIWAAPPAAILETVKERFRTDVVA